MPDIEDMPAWVDQFIDGGPQAAKQAIDDVMDAAYGEYRTDLRKHKDTGETADSAALTTKLTARTAGGDLTVSTIAGVFLEIGTSRQPPRPYMTRAVRRAQRRWKTAVDAHFDSQVRP